MNNKFKLIFVILFVFVLVFLGFLVFSKNNKSPNSANDLIEKTEGQIKEKFSIHSQCPQNLSGILTYPLMEPKYISALTPLGNINPPGHTSPVDHIYFATNYNDKIPLYAPADSIITNITTISQDDGTGNYVTKGYVIQYTICDGLVLDFASYTDITQTIKDEIVKQGDKDCKYGIKKPGHEGGAEGQCYFRVYIPVKSGDVIGWVQREKRVDGNGYSLPFEIWAANYNQDPPKQTNWEYYNDDRYAHIICPFDLYAGELKNQFYAKFGMWDDAAFDKDGKKTVTTDGSGYFIARNREPLCGQVDQDVVGTIQGMWFAEKPREGEAVEFEGKGLAFLHNNIDTTQGEISVGGDLIGGQAGVIFFQPKNNGILNREPSEVKADGTIYCYDASGRWGSEMKFLVQLIDDYHLKAEIQTGLCKTQEAFLKPFFYER